MSGLALGEARERGVHLLSIVQLPKVVLGIISVVGAEFGHEMQQVALQKRDVSLLTHRTFSSRQFVEALGLVSRWASCGTCG